MAFPPPTLKGPAFVFLPAWTLTGLFAAGISPVTLLLGRFAVTFLLPSAGLYVQLRCGGVLLSTHSTCRDVGPSTRQTHAWGLAPLHAGAPVPQ